MSNIRLLSELFQIYEDNPQNRILYFRGQAFDWPLKPSLARESVSDEERENENKCFEKLKEVLPNVNDWERATIAQHYGIPTRLLDWSENPLVGLYFALDSEEHDNEDGVVWVFEDKTAVASGVASFGDDGPRQLGRPRPYRAWQAQKQFIPRTKAQCGSLTSQPDLSKTFDEQDFDSKTQSLRKYLVQKVVKKKLREQLEFFGVTKQTLFPDFLDIGNRRPIDLVGTCMRIRCELFKG